jgi:uncharacterized protein (TIGR02996 family)
MSIAESLRALVAKSPRDLAVRSVYADALLQEGDPRGTFISLQTHLAGPLPPDRREAAKHEIAALMRANGERWTELARPWADVRFKGGFIHAIRAKASDFVARGAALLAAEPVLEVTLTDAHDEDVVALAAMPAIAGVESLTIRGDFDEGSTALAKSPHLAALKSLNVMGAGEGFVAAISSLRALETLCLTGIGLGDEVIATLAKADLPSLETLYLARTETSDEGVAALAKGRALAKVRVLCLGGNEITDEGAQAIAKGKSLAKVERLELNQTGITNDGAIALAKSRTLAALKRLDLRGSEATRVGLDEARKRKGLVVLGRSW